jgi:hypothetical protein
MGERRKAVHKKKENIYAEKTIWDRRHEDDSNCPKERSRTIHRRFTSQSGPFVVAGRIAQQK